MKNSYSLFFIRHGKLLLPYKNHREMPFEILADLASEKLNPSIDKQFTQFLINQVSTIIPFKELEKIYTSPSKRCQETAILISDFVKKNFKKKLPTIILPELKEIDFNLEKIFSSLVYKDFNIETINNSVFRAMIKGKNCESVFESYKRIKYLFKKLNKIDKSKKILLITHDFLMRVIELYIKNQGKDVTITYEDLRKTKRNLYLHGFATDYKLSQFFIF